MSGFYIDAVLSICIQTSCVNGSQIKNKKWNIVVGLD